MPPHDLERTHDVANGAPTRVIDTHLHVWQVDAPWMSWLNDRPDSWQVTRRDFPWTELRTELDHAGVDELVLVQAGMATEETLQLLALAQTQPRVLGVVGWATMRSPQALSRDLDALDSAGSTKLVGIRTNQGWAPDGDILTAPGVTDSCRVLAERGLPLDVHVQDCTQLPLAIALIDRVPDGRYVIDHLGKPLLSQPDAFEDWARSMTTLSQHRNVYVKLSGWSTFVNRVRASDVRPYADLVLDTFGADRVMYGGNWPVALVGGTYQQTYRATLEAIAHRPAEQLEDVFHRSAAACYLQHASR